MPLQAEWLFSDNANEKGKDSGHWIRLTRELLLKKNERLLADNSGAQRATLHVRSEMPASWVKSSGGQGQTAGVKIGILPGREGVMRRTRRKKDRKKIERGSSHIWTQGVEPRTAGDNICVRSSFGYEDSALDMTRAHEYVEKERKTPGGLCQKRWDILLARLKNEERRNEANKKEKARKKDNGD
ncbi:hypothetical protein K438DRAFT_1778696 [Mycena galopus ATCC 62051]|nr:hypothetical protein K438DRAFT_1778696 [Mycena galopus ATCC 62051]